MMDPRAYREASGNYKHLSKTGMVFDSQRIINYSTHSQQIHHLDCFALIFTRKKRRKTNTIIIIGDKIGSLENEIFKTIGIHWHS